MAVSVGLILAGNRQPHKDISLVSHVYLFPSNKEKWDAKGRFVALNWHLIISILIPILRFMHSRFKIFKYK
jgi:hypothetical protein